MLNAAEMTQAEVCEHVIALLAKHTKMDATDWTAASVLTEIGVDSFDFVEFVFIVEDAFGIEIDYNANDMAKSLSTIGAVAEAIRRISSQKTVAVGTAATAPSAALPA